MSWEPQGNETLVSLRPHGESRGFEHGDAFITVRVDPQKGANLQVGELVGALPDWTQVLMFDLRGRRLAPNLKKVAVA